MIWNISSWHKLRIPIMVFLLWQRWVLKRLLFVLWGGRVVRVAQVSRLNVLFFCVLLGGSVWRHETNDRRPSDDAGGKPRAHQGATLHRGAAHRPHRQAVLGGQSWHTGAQTQVIYSLNICMFGGTACVLSLGSGMYIVFNVCVEWKNELYAMWVKERKELCVCGRKAWLLLWECVRGRERKIDIFWGWSGPWKRALAFFW